MAGSTPRIFTPQTATQTLPLVQAIVRDARDAWKRLESAKRELRRTAARAAHDQARLTSDVRELEREIDDLRCELEQLGCYLKDTERGLVDFPAFVGYELVYLCWSPGETAITHYHGMREGFVGRRPIPPEGEAARTHSNIENETPF